MPNTKSIGWKRSTRSQLQYDRLDGVAKARPGLVAQQEIDDAKARTWH